MLLVCVPVFSMPPHPGVIETYEREGKLTELTARMSAMQSRVPAQKTSALRSSSMSGTVYVPVVLAAFGTPYQSAGAVPAVPAQKNNLPVSPVFLLLLLGFAGMLGSMMLPSLRKRAAISVPVLAAALAVSCGSGGANEPYFPTPVSHFDTILNGTGADNEISARQYFKDMSNGSLTIQFDFFGPVKVPNAWNYYGQNVNNGDAHLGEFIHDAVAAAVDQNASTDFSKYDNNGDGMVDAVIVVHQGPGEESGADASTIWSCMWSLSSANAYGDGGGPVTAGSVTFDVFTAEPEYITNEGDMTIGVFCHETGHVLGLPDLYDTSGETNGVGIWSIMAAGSWCSADGYNYTSDGSRPAPLLGWERARLGWAAVVDSTGSVAVDDIESTHQAHMVKLKTATPTNDPNAMAQYFLLEGKNASSESSASTSRRWYVPGTGILVTQIHEGVVYANIDYNSVNDGIYYPHGVNVIEAGTSSGWSYSNEGIAGYLKYGQGKLWDPYAGYGGSAADLFGASAQTLSAGADAAWNTCWYNSYYDVTSKTGSSGVSLSFPQLAILPATVTMTVP